MPRLEHVRIMCWDKDSPEGEENNYDVDCVIDVDEVEYFFDDYDGMINIAMKSGNRLTIKASVEAFERVVSGKTEGTEVTCPDCGGGVESKGNMLKCVVCGRIFDGV